MPAKANTPPIPANIKNCNPTPSIVGAVAATAVAKIAYPIPNTIKAKPVTAKAAAPLFTCLSN